MIILYIYEFENQCVAFSMEKDHYLASYILLIVHVSNK